jgi:protein farnesyltransferase subunit beta
MNRNPDAYHTLYCLSGLSAAQHHVFPSSTRRAEIMKAWVSSSGKRTPYIYEITSERKGDIIDTKTPETEELRKHIFCNALSWTEEEGGSIIIGGKDNRVVCLSLPSTLIQCLPFAPPAECYTPDI